MLTNFALGVYLVARLLTAQGEVEVTYWFSTMRECVDNQAALHRRPPPGTRLRAVDCIPERRSWETI